MKTSAPVVVATWANLSNDVAHVHVLLPLVFVAQWYSFESEPPGKRSARLSMSVSIEMVLGVSNTLSQTAALMPKCRESTLRIVCVASIATLTLEGGGGAM